MGVHGLWQLLQPTGKPVSLQSLEGKILAVDVSIWLHQAVKGMRDAHGNPLPNAHLQVLFNRVCKLLFYRIKPVFVFDGGVPALKKQTMAARREKKEYAENESQKTSDRLLQNLMEKAAVKHVLGKQIEPSISAPTKAVKGVKGSKDDMFNLPPLPEEFKREHEKENEEDNWEARVLQRQIIADTFENLSEVDVNSEDFLSLPLEIQHEIITDMLADRKKNSWGTMHEFPEKSDNFSSFQMTKILKQSSLATRKEEVEKEMTNKLSGDLTKQLVGDDFYSEGAITTQRVVSEDQSHFILIKGLSKQRRDEELAKASQLHQSQIDYNEEEDESSNDNRDPLLNDSDEEKKKREELMQISWINEKKISKPSSVIDDEPKPGCSKDYVDLTSDSCKQSVNNKPQTNRFVINVDDYESEESDSYIDLKKAAFQVLNHVKSVKGNNSCPLPLENRSHGSEIEDDGASVKKKPRMDYEVVAKKAAPEVKSSEESDDEGFIEINIDPNKVVEDDLFPADIFSTSTAAVSEAPQLQKSSHDMETDDSVDESPIKKSSFDVEIDDSVKVLSEEPGIETEQNSALMGQSDNGKPSIRQVLHSPEIKKHDLAKEFKDYMQDNGKLTNVRRGALRALEEQKARLKNLIQEQDKIEKQIQKDNDLEVQQKQPETENPVELEEKHADVEEWQKREKVIETEHELEKREKLQEKMERQQDELEQLGKNLRQEKGKQDRLAMSISDQMYVEAQELLRLFGLPYVVSPTEAESQCAFLDLTDQTDGTVTDDSDIWLFGGKRVYKNFFNQDKHVEFFTDGNIQKQFGLMRQQMINIALLCGSDYTEGIAKVGPVSAIEIMAEFPGEGIRGLIDFKKWWDEVQKNNPIQESKLRAKLRKLQIKPGFPSHVVVDAYLKPVVDSSREKFSWGTPDLDLLREFTRQKFGWKKEKSDEVLLPMMKQVNSKLTQGRIDGYFQPENFLPPKKLKSSRVHQALTKLSAPADIPSVEEVNNERKAVAAKIMNESKGKGQASGRGKGKGKVQRGGSSQAKRPKFTAVSEVALSESSSGSSSGSSSEEDSSSDEEVISKGQKVQGQRVSIKKKSVPITKKKRTLVNTKKSKTTKKSQYRFEGDDVAFMKEEESLSLGEKLKSHFDSLERGFDMNEMGDVANISSQRTTNRGKGSKFVQSGATRMARSSKSRAKSKLSVIDHSDSESSSD